MTETSPLASGAFIKPELQHLSEEERYPYYATAGVPAPLVDLRIVDDDGKEQPWDGRSRGEIQVRGQFITGSYHDVPVEPDKFTSDGWLRTGDVATVDEHGYIRIVDRTKDLIKSGGEWISSVDMENLLMAHPAVAEASIIAVPDVKWTERPLACVVFAPASVRRPRNCASISRNSSRSGNCLNASNFSTRSRAPRRASSGKRSSASSLHAKSEWPQSV